LAPEVIVAKSSMGPASSLSHVPRISAIPGYCNRIAFTLASPRVATSPTFKPTPVAELKDRVRKTGLRSTGARISVLRIMEEAETPLTHQEVSAKLEGAGYDHATIYRNLTDLTEVGLLSRSDLGDHVWRFELRRGDADHKSQHPHFVCIDCGGVSCLSGEAISINKAAGGAPRALKRRGVVIQIQGRCDKCDREAASAR
jgi:Fur family transcriptional regulator, ferric uptake regulator